MKRFSKKNKYDLDIYRLTINNLLKLDKIKNNDKEKNFYLFLYNDDFNQFDEWFKICSAKKNFEENINNLKNILDIFKKSDKIVSFKKLFELDKNWYEFFKHNADNTGKIKTKEKRLGVDKNYVNDIILIQNKIKEFDHDLDKSIAFYQKIKLICFIHLN